IRKSGLIAIGIDEDDQLAWTRITSGSDDLIVATHDGVAIRFNESDARPLSRLARGVKAITLNENDYVVGMAIAREDGELLTVTEKGQGRRTPISEYRVQYRGGKGIKNYSGKGGAVAGVKVVDPEDDIIMISVEGIIIRMHVEDINVQSRYAGGVRVMRLAENDMVVTVARTPRSEDEDESAEIMEAEQETGIENETESSEAAPGADE
ncbi:MAG: DNA gyrase C-terminal beta-propeller domain-containing protein, partial [Pygmaiobacter sp.]